MNLRTVLTIICMAILTVFAVHTVTRADGKGFAGVYPFVTSSSLLGLFNQNDGKIYVYDNDFSKCLYEGQVQELGKPIVKVHSEKPTTIKPYEQQ